MSTAAKVGLAVLAGLIVLALLTPVHGADTIPRQCFSVVGYEVPCGDGIALAAGAVTAAVVGFSLWITSHRASRSVID